MWNNVKTVLYPRFAVICWAIFQPIEMKAISYEEIFIVDVKDDSKRSIAHHKCFGEFHENVHDLNV